MKVSFRIIYIVGIGTTTFGSMIVLNNQYKQESTPKITPNITAKTNPKMTLYITPNITTKITLKITPKITPKLTTNPPFINKPCGIVPVQAIQRFLSTAFLYPGRRIGKE